MSGCSAFITFIIHHFFLSRLSHHVLLNFLVSCTTIIKVLPVLSYFYSTSPPVDPRAPTFHAVSTNLADADLFGELEPNDTEWLCSGGFVTETQIFYVITDDGTSIMCQVIHSSVG